MGFRIFKGHANSENGWPYVDQDSCTWITVPGTDPPVRLQVQNGQPLIILPAFAADINAYVEHVTDDDSACWTEDNSVDTSNHPGGTAIDIDWDRHKFEVSYDGFNEAQIATCRELLEFYEGTVYWGQDWGLQNIGPFDCMHWQMGYDTFDNPHTQDFINRKIRPDGFSTFRRGAQPLPSQQPVSGRDVIALLIIGEAKLRGYTRDETIAELSTGIQESGLDQDATDSTGHRGVYQQDGGYPNRETAQGNVSGHFDRMAAKRRSPGASPDIWRNIFWLQQRPGENSADEAVANGRQGYMDEIKSHIAEATGLYDRLAAAAPAPVPQPQPQPPGGELTTDQMIKAIYDVLFTTRRSKSKFVNFGDPGDPTDWTLVDYLNNDDAFAHESEVIRMALNGDLKARRMVQKCADAGDVECRTVMRQINAPPATTQTPTPTPTPLPSPPGSSGQITGTSIAATISALAGSVAQLGDQMQQFRTILNDTIGGS